MTNITSAPDAGSPIVEPVTNGSFLDGCKKILNVFKPSNEEQTPSTEPPAQQKFSVMVVSLASGFSVSIPCENDPDALRKINGCLADNSSNLLLVADNVIINKEFIEMVYLK